MRNYEELLTLDTFEERLKYLKVTAPPTEQTFGPLRGYNQKFYRSREWRLIRDYVIARDLGYDLAVPGRHIWGRILVHHMNPLSPKDIIRNPNIALDPNTLISVSHDTHLAIHFTHDRPPIPSGDRAPGDTRLW